MYNKYNKNTNLNGAVWKKVSVALTSKLSTFDAQYHSVFLHSLQYCSQCYLAKKIWLSTTLSLYDLQRMNLERIQKNSSLLLLLFLFQHISDHVCIRVLFFIRSHFVWRRFSMNEYAWIVCMVWSRSFMRKRAGAGTLGRVM